MSRPLADVLKEIAELQAAQVDIRTVDQAARIAARLTDLYFEKYEIEMETP